MNERELENWLKDKPRHVAVAVASRAALRVVVKLPWDELSEAEDWRMTFTSLRCLLLSSLAAVYSSDDKKITDFALFADSAAHSANSAEYLDNSAARSAKLSVALFADSAVLSAHSSLFSVVDTANSSPSFVADSAARSAFEIWPEVEWDMVFLAAGQTPKDLANQKLFNTPNNDWSAADFQRLRNVAKEHPEYKWWINWLLAMHNGTFRDWELAYSIGTEIPEKTWGQGAVAVALKIEEYAQQQITDEGLEETEGIVEDKAHTEESSELDNLTKGGLQSILAQAAVADVRYDAEFNRIVTQPIVKNSTDESDAKFEEISNAIVKGINLYVEIDKNSNSNTAIAAAFRSYVEEIESEEINARALDLYMKSVRPHLYGDYEITNLGPDRAELLRGIIEYHEELIKNCFPQVWRQKTIFYEFDLSTFHNTLPNFHRELDLIIKNNEDFFSSEFRDIVGTFSSNVRYFENLGYQKASFDKRELQAAQETVNSDVSFLYRLGFRMSEANKFIRNKIREKGSQDPIGLLHQSSAIVKNLWDIIKDLLDKFDINNFF